MNELYKIILRILCILITLLGLCIVGLAIIFWGPLGMILEFICRIFTGNTYEKYTQWLPNLTFELFDLWTCHLENNKIINF